MRRRSRNSRISRHFVSSSSPSSPNTSAMMADPEMRFHWRIVDADTAEPESNRTPDPRPNSQRAQHFAAVYEAIRKMVRLPAEHDLHVDIDAARRSMDVLAVLGGNFDIDPPKIFPHEGESLVLTWDQEVIKRYLTISAADMDVMHVHKESNIRCEHQIDANSAEVIRWLADLGGAPTAKTALDIDAF